MIKLQHETTKYIVTETNAGKYRKIFDSGKFPKIKSPQKTPIRRDYPVFYAGMTTSEYVHLFNRQFDAIHVKLQHGCENYYKPAPMLDATFPEVVEDFDPDYMEPVRATKSKKTATTAQLRKACQCALDLLENPDADAFDANQVIKQLREVLA